MEVMNQPVAMAFLARETPEWDAAWAAIALTHGDTACRHEETGDTWQYMGSAKFDRPDGTALWVHQFRHRCLPSTGDRAYCQVSATAAWEPAEERAL